MTRRTVKLADNTISAEEMSSLADWLKEGHQVTKGPLTRQFEAEFAAYSGTKYSIMVNSGSSANLLMAYSLLEAGYLKNKKVIVPAVSWITTLSPFIQLGFDCFLCDSDAEDLGVDLNHLEALLKKEQPALLILVHILGHPNKMEAIHRLCEQHGCQVIEDACEALGSEYGGQKTGALSLAGSFSFYYGHHISTIEGGAITTSDDKLYSVMLSIRSHGWSRDVPEADRIAWRKEHDIDEFREFYSFYYPGYNLRSSDLNAFLGRGQLQRLPDIAKAREHNFELYRKALTEFWSQRSERSFVSSFAYGTFVKNRLAVFHHLKTNGIECRPLVCGSMGRQPFWIKRYGVTHLTVADRVHDFGLYLPNHANITPDDISYVARCFKEVAEPL
ncbi:MAG: DegT/DnrJ/EryC1/StrS family aminotransferase [Verrucomicrobia bacterium]|jgi:CDP-6-deoxy-D-xylo-4-hexulose-3-dehydrase|nr:DegT/DnrJ/EryC1/StrS family aminotransferase [Verrucomicrobiota bacterium]NBS04988.1 DegT/DnrJ/EryC1/StrS family aminotransferase [Verrucomicrobiota bacterium]NBY36176.1 DegT/DnrJ/EryC1/StrS family aminotransferase [Verrucomicrobiota bacterium]